LYEFHITRDYFECHEILEEHWKKDPPDHRNILWIGFIQMAVAFYHYRRKNFTGAKKLMDKTIVIFETEKRAVSALGLDCEKLLALLRSERKNTESHVPYQSIDLPFSDPQINGLFRKKGDPVKKITETSYLIHKHTMRDRSAIINERRQQLEKRKKSRGY
jgi:predicted metal-dependent hydrolase